MIATSPRPRARAAGERGHPPAAKHDRAPRDRRRGGQPPPGRAKRIERGLEAYERRLAVFDAVFSVGDELTMADLFLVPQFVNGLRFGANLTAFPRVSRICTSCLATPEAVATHPARVTPAR
jgi:glutathione S-transferase